MSSKWKLVRELREFQDHAGKGVYLAQLAVDAARAIETLHSELAAANARIAELDWAPKRAKEVSDLRDEALRIGAFLVRHRQDDLKLAGMAVNALAGKWAKHVESAAVDIRRLSDELAALKTADAKRIVALTRACSLVLLFSGVPYDISWLGDDYSEEIVAAARKRLEETDERR